MLAASAQAKQNVHASGTNSLDGQRPPPHSNTPDRKCEIRRDPGGLLTWSHCRPQVRPGGTDTFPAFPGQRREAGTTMPPTDSEKNAVLLGRILPERPAQRLGKPFQVLHVVAVGGVFHLLTHRFAECGEFYAPTCLLTFNQV